MAKHINDGSIEKYLPYVGIPTFLRAPHTQNMDGVDIVVMGNPFDSGTSNRPGARLGPRALREQSLQVGSYQVLYPWEYDVKEEAKIIDYGDVIGDVIGAGATVAMVEAMQDACTKVYDAGASVLVLGGDHTNPYGPMRAAAAKHGKLSIIHFDSHQDAIKTGDNHYNHGSFAWDLVQEGVIDDSRSVQSYIRTRCHEDCAQNYHIFYANEALKMGPEALAKKIREVIGDNPAYITFDIDALDPAYAPATGTPVCGGPSVHEVRQVLWALKGLNIVGADLVEVAPNMDSNNQMTSIAGATIAIDMVYLMAEARKVFR